MLSIELSTSQKVQIGFITAILGVAAFMFFYNSRPAPDDAVNAWTSPVRRFPVDPKKPFGPNNPYNPKKEATISGFACYDGQLEITEYRNDPERHPTIVWAKIDKRRTHYIYYQDPMEPVKLAKEPYAHAIALAAYNAANGRMLGLMADAALTPDQIAAEKKARQEMTDQLTVVKMDVDAGTRHQDLLDKVMAALEAFRKMPGDPLTDKAKAKAVRDVLKTAGDYLAKVQQDRIAIIEKYIATMNTVLTADQKPKVAERARVFEAANNRTTPRPAPTPPRPAPRTAPARGPIVPPPLQG